MNTIYNVEIYSFDFTQPKELKDNQLIKVKTTLVQEKNITVFDEFEMINKRSSWIIQVIH